ncbi:hypothetical protein DM860_016392 [Cuscuta australis]|uniref:Uncharacterized protein n=1 Tax=Cuscuta australis TaxID=267555 RepID=A0A328DFA5_9ASTE|nr:hypothetical protein DM860_016392 [Cuscuta australis]
MMSWTQIYPNPEKYGWIWHCTFPLNTDADLEIGFLKWCWIRNSTSVMGISVSTPSHQSRIRMENYLVKPRPSYQDIPNAIGTMQLPLKTAKDIECIEKGGRVVQVLSFY